MFGLWAHSSRISTTTMWTLGVPEHSRWRNFAVLFSMTPCYHFYMVKISLPHTQKGPAAPHAGVQRGDAPNMTSGSGHGEEHGEGAQGS